MFRMPERNDPNFHSILINKWKHISEGDVRGQDSGCQSCRRRSCTVTCDGINSEFFLAQLADFILTIVTSAEKAPRAGAGNLSTFYRFSEGSLCNKSHTHPGKDFR